MFDDSSGYINIIRLKWSHEKDYSPKDIDEIAKRLDVCYVFKGEDLVHFFTEKYPSGNQTDFPPGTYLVTVRVRCDNTSPVDKKFLIKYDSRNFDSLRIEDYK